MQSVIQALHPNIDDRSTGKEILALGFEETRDKAGLGSIFAYCRS
jgi:hypothetical protein